MKTTAKRLTVINAIENVNKIHNYKLTLNRDETIGKYFFFTIKSEKSGIPGSRFSHSGRKLISASWHAHGYLFEEIFKNDPSAIIKSMDKTITKDYGNWEDKNIGSYYSPKMYSETSIL